MKGWVGEASKGETNMNDLWIDLTKKIVRRAFWK